MPARVHSCFSVFFRGSFRSVALLALAGVLNSLGANREVLSPPPSDPYASPYATPGGVIRMAAFQPPKSLNAYIDNNTYTHMVFDLMFETLLTTDPATTEFSPYLANEWELSDDRLTFTFTLDPDARWSDGQPVTAEDVAWTFSAVMSPSNATGAAKVMLGVFNPPHILNAHTIRFHAKEPHWRNLLALGTFEILPAHVYAKQDFNRLNLERPVVSGPYTLGGEREQIELRMTRRPDWWARERPAFRHTMNFDTVIFRYYTDVENAFEAFKKHQVDLYSVYSARIWANETLGPKFAKNWIVRQQIKTHNPVGFQGFAMNMRRPPFDDVRVRRALAHLVDRETMNRTLMFNSYFLHRSYFEDLYDTEHPCTNTVYAYAPSAAKALLAEAGYRKNPQTGLLEKNGHPLAFKFLTRDGGSDKFLALCHAAFREVGIAMSIERKDFAAWMRDMDAYNFDITWASWSSSIFRDPEPLWASAEADRPSGNNITGFKNARVDALIAKQKNCYRISERNEICREIDSILTAEVPYVLLWNLNATRLLYWDSFGVPETVLPKYGDDHSPLIYWWYDPDTAASLQHAIRKNEVLPARPVTVDFDSFQVKPVPHH